MLKAERFLLPFLLRVLEGDFLIGHLSHLKLGITVWLRRRKAWVLPSRTIHYFPQSLVRTQNCPHASERWCEGYLRFCLGRLPEGIPCIKKKQSYSWKLMEIAADPWWSLQHHLNNMQVRSVGRHHTLARQKENRSWILPVDNFAIKCQQDTWE